MEILQALSIGIQGQQAQSFLAAIPPHTLRQGLGTTLNPKERTYLGLVGPSQNRLLSFYGQWRAGNPGHDWLGPDGNPGVRFQGFNKWSVLIVATDFFSRNVLYVLQSPGSGKGVNCPGLDSTGTHLYAIMNDDDFRDNENHPTDPMRCG